MSIALDYFSINLCKTYSGNSSTIRFNIFTVFSRKYTFYTRYSQNNIVLLFVCTNSKFTFILGIYLFECFHIGSAKDAFLS